MFHTMSAKGAKDDEEKKKQRQKKDEELKQRRNRQAFETKKERNNDRIAVLLECDFDEVISGNWRGEKPTKIDLSAEKFKLETLTGEPFKGLLNEDLNRRRITFVDVSANRLRDISIFQEGEFPCLTVLIARRNMISTAVLALPRLLEINLAHNEMKILPILSGLPMLEVLIVAHNQLEGTFDNLQKNKRLRRIDLSYNKYRISAHQLTQGLEALAMLPNLSDLRLIENPFVAYIKEYQIFVLKKLKDLKKLDGVVIEPSIRSELDNYSNIFALETYNEIFDGRQDELQAKEASASMKQGTGPKVQQNPQYNTLIALLDEILDDTSVLLPNVQQVHGLSGHMVDIFLMSAVPDEEDKEEDEYGRVEHLFWEGCEERFPNSSAAVTHFLELILSVMERHDTVRMQLIESLANFACMKKFGFGMKCMSTLGTLMASSESGKDEVCAILDKVLIKNLTAFTSQSMNTYHCQTLIEGLVQIMGPPNIALVIGQSLSPLMESLIQYFIEKQAVEAKFCVKLLAHGTEIPENAVKAAERSMVDKVIVVLENPTISEDMSVRELWLDTLLLAKNLAIHGNADVYNQIVETGIHGRLISRLRSIRSSGLHVGNTLNARTLAGILKFIYCMMQKDEVVLKECCQSFHILREATELVKEHGCKAFILSEAVKIVTLVLNNQQMCKLHIQVVVKELSKLKPCLNYLGLKKYEDLFEQGQVQKPDVLDPSSPVNDVLIQMLGIIEFFADVEQEGMDDDVEAVKDQVNKYLNQEGREHHVLAMLSVPNEDVKMAVLNCIGKVPVDQFELHEMGLIIKFLCDSHNIGAGRMEVILAETIAQLERLATGEGETHDLFRRRKADEAIAKTYDILHINAARATFGHEEEEEEKAKLSIACVSFLSACSRFSYLHEHLRSQRIQMSFFKIMKFEEELLRPTCPDVALEQTWTGRSIETLMRCFTPGKEALDRNKKIAFRVMFRIADVIEGKTDGLREKTQGYTLEQICQREASMWDSSKTENMLRHLDDQELEDRKRETIMFVQSDGVTTILKYLCHTQTMEREAVYQKQLNDAQDSKDNIRENARLMEKKEEDEDKARRENDDEVELKLEDEEDTYETGSGLNCLMRAAQSCEDTVDEDDDAIFVTHPPNFAVEEQSFVGDEKDGRMNQSFITAAAFRCVYALITVPPTPFCRSQTIHTMRDPTMVKRLLSIMEINSYLSCNLAAKFLYVMIQVLDVGVFGHKDPGKRLEICALLSKYADKICAGMVKLLRLTKDKRLGQHEQTLCVEVARLLAMITRLVPFFKGALFTDRPEVQDSGITETLDWLIPRDGLRLCIAMVLYELQLDAGAGIGNAISKDYVLESFLKKPMKERATHFLSHYMVRCPERKYDILEVFNVAEVFQRMQVRPSYLRDLLDEANMQRFMMFLEKQFAEIVKIENDRLVMMALVKVLDGASTIVTGVFANSTELVCMLKPDPEAPPYKNSQAGREWDPSWELEFPRPPGILWQYSHTCVRRVFRLFGSQMLGIEWDFNDSSTAGANFLEGWKAVSKVPRLFGKPASTNCTVVIFNRSRDRDRLARALIRKASQHEQQLESAGYAPPKGTDAVSGSDATLTILNDNTVKEPVMKMVGKSELLMATVAISIDAAAPRMFVLTMEKVHVFTIDMGAWNVPDDPGGLQEDIEFIPKDVLPEPPGGDRQPESAPLANRAGGKNGADVSASEVLAHEHYYKLPPKAITFDDTSEQPDLICDFSTGELKIRFYDDTGREDWRRALAYYLQTTHKDHGKWERNNPRFDGR